MNRLPSNEATSTAPTLLDQVCGKIRLKHYSLRTEQLYTVGIRRFIARFDKTRPKARNAVDWPHCRPRRMTAVSKSRHRAVQQNG